MFRRLDLFKVSAIALFIAASGAPGAQEKILSVRGEVLLGLGGAGAAGGAVEGGIFTENGLFLSLQGAGGGMYGGGLANFGLYFDNSPSLGQVIGISGGYQNVSLKTVVNNQNNETPIDTVKENHLSFGGIFWKLLIGKKGMFDITNRVLLGTSKVYDYSNYPLVEKSEFNLTYSLGLGYAFGGRKRAVIEEPIAEPVAEPVVVEEPIVVKTPAFFTVSASFQPHAGNIHTSADTTVEEGSDLELVFSPNEGFALENILVNSKPAQAALVNDKHVLTLRNISQHLSVEAKFEKVLRIADVDETITFTIGTSHLSPEAKKTLDILYKTLVENPDTKVQIEGHTDISGHYEHNDVLSRRRADAVADYLIGKGIAASRLLSIGHGHSKPVADNETEDGRVKNRRVEIRTITE